MPHLATAYKPSRKPSDHILANQHSSVKKKNRPKYALDFMAIFSTFRLSKAKM